MAKVLLKKTFKPTPEQRRITREDAERRGVDPAARDDRSLYEALEALRCAWAETQNPVADAAAPAFPLAASHSGK